MQDRQYSEQNNPLFSKSSKSEVDEQPKKKEMGAGRFMLYLWTMIRMGFLEQ